MADQFDLYRNPQGGLFLILHNEAVDTLDTRIFASVVPSGRAGIVALDRLSVPLVFAEREYRVMVKLLGAVRLGWMGEKLGNYANLREKVTHAFGLLYSGI